MNDVLRDVEPVRARVLVGVVVALAGVLAVIWLVVMRSPITRDVVLATGGLVQATLLASAVTALVVSGVLVAFGVPLRELGLRRRDVPRAAALLVVLYAALQLAIVVVALVHGDPLVLAPLAPLVAVGRFAAQVVGNALVEEAVFRGFLLRQLVVRAQRRGGVGTIVAAVAIAAIVFGLWHIPVRIHEGYRGLDLVATLVVAALGGALAGYLYLRGGNLLVVVVLHALFNDQAALVRSPVPSQWILCVLAIGAIAWIAWPRRDLRA